MTKENPPFSILRYYSFCHSAFLRHSSAFVIRHCGKVPPPARPILTDVTRSALLPVVALVAGCADARVYTCPCAARMTVTAPDPAPVPAYRIGCPDVLTVSFIDRPDWDGTASVDVDGRLPLGDAGRPAVAGLPLADARLAVAKAAGLPPARVSVELASPRAGRVYVVGPENGLQRAVPYRGPERVVEFLWRTGAVTRGCADLRAVAVVRPNVAAGGPPTLFDVDVEAVVLAGDQRTNVVLEPSDEVVVGETRRSSFARLLPDWLRPTYEAIVGMFPSGWVASSSGGAGF
jgi:protein involved in polysaccharide export with SLBB domain